MSQLESLQEPTEKPISVAFLVCHLSGRFVSGACQSANYGAVGPKAETGLPSNDIPSIQDWGDQTKAGDRYGGACMEEGMFGGTGIVEQVWWGR